VYLNYDPPTSAGVPKSSARLRVVACAPARPPCCFLEVYQHWGPISLTLSAESYFALPPLSSFQHWQSQGTNLLKLCQGPHRSSRSPTTPIAPILSHSSSPRRGWLSAHASIITPCHYLKNYRPLHDNSELLVIPPNSNKE
jgi:hypothetical protein